MSAPSCTRTRPSRRSLRLRASPFPPATTWSRPSAAATFAWRIILIGSPVILPDAEIAGVLKGFATYGLQDGKGGKAA